MFLIQIEPTAKPRSVYVRYLNEAILTIRVDINESYHYA